MRLEKCNVYPIAGEEDIIKELVPIVINYSNDNVTSLEFIEVTKYNEKKYKQYNTFIQLAKKRNKRFWLVYVNKEK